MGCNGGLAVFDYDKYINVIVPALREGEMNDFIAGEIINFRKFKRDKLDHGFEGLAEVMSYFNHDLTSCALSRGFVVKDGKLLSKECSDTAKAWGHEELQPFLEFILSMHCFRYISLFSSYLSNHVDLFLLCNSLGEDITVAGSTRELIMKLGDLTSFWINGYGGFTDGIHGWLDPEETLILSYGLAEIQEEEAYQPDEEHIEQVRIFKKIADTAVKLGQGLLWGGDFLLFNVTDWSKYGSRYLEITEEVRNAFLNRKYF